MARKKKGRKYRRNSMIGTLKSSALSAFNMGEIKDTAVIIGGNLVTTYIAGQIAGRVAAIRGSRVLSVGTTLLTAGLVGAAARRFIPRHAKGLFDGGMIAGVSQALRTFVPTVFGNLRGMDDWGDEMGRDWGFNGVDDYADPREIAGAIGINDYADPREIAGAVGINDYVDPRQIASARALEGMAEDAIAEEIAMSM